MIDVAYTIKSRDPVLQGHSLGLSAISRPGVVGRFHLRALWPKSKPIRWRATEGMPQPVLAPTADGQELVVDKTTVEAPKPPKGAPLRYGNLATLEFSQFARWSDVSALMWPLFAKASALGPNSPIKAQVEAIAAASPDPKARALAALRLVEDKIRYVNLAMNSGGLTPADIDLTWARRFGDCKGKTVLLLALLKGLGSTGRRAGQHPGGGWAGPAAAGAGVRPRAGSRRDRRQDLLA